MFSGSVMTGYRWGTQTVSRLPRQRDGAPQLGCIHVHTNGRCAVVDDRRSARKKGSSRITGERGADLEEEVFLVAVPV
ncbi:hypothetical protein, partial [Burkholderia pseudomultivorans]|uniref:hypothetical protein n=1 Tax=Burkholderia pseudomultivorans TaxID=1207504 RepID=UPI001E2E02C1